MAFCSTSKHADLFLFPDPLDDRENVFDDAGRKAERRFVEHEQPRRHHQRAGDRQHLLLAAGQGARLLTPPVGENGKIAVHALHVRRRMARARIAAEPQVLLDRQPDEGSAPFRHMRNAHARDLFRCAPVYPLSGEQDFAFAADHAADRPQRCRLAGAIGAKKHGHAAFLDRDIDPVHDFGLAVEGLH